MYVILDFLLLVGGAMLVERDFRMERVGGMGLGDNYVGCY